eukprot:1160313-Pleurochrysis_carterae.AAC.3
MALKKALVTALGKTEHERYVTTVRAAARQTGRAARAAHLPRAPDEVWQQHRAEDVLCPVGELRRPYDASRHVHAWSSFENEETSNAIMKREEGGEKVRRTRA